MGKNLRLLVLVLLASGCPNSQAVPSGMFRDCAEACGDSGVQNVTSVECQCQSPLTAPSTVPLDPVGC